MEGKKSEKPEKLKMIFLVCSKGNLYEDIKVRAVEKFSAKKVIDFIAESRDVETESRLIYNKIKKFLRLKNRRVLIVKFSGNQETYRATGDEWDELISAISDDEESVYFVPNAVDVFDCMSDNIIAYDEYLETHTK